MKICGDHWALMRAAVETRGMSGLVAKDGETAAADMLAELQGEPDPKSRRFDPLMSMHWHFTSNALECGGLYLMGQTADGGEYCPVCEFALHMKGFDAAAEIEKVADQMQAWCREEGLLPQPS